jgi:hypothetical protein
MRVTRGAQFGSPPLDGSIVYDSSLCPVIGDRSPAAPDRFDGASAGGFRLRRPAAYVRTRTRVPFSADGLCTTTRTIRSHVRTITRQGRGRIGSHRHVSRFFTFSTPGVPRLMPLSSSAYWVYGTHAYARGRPWPPRVWSARQPQPAWCASRIIARGQF